MVTQVPGGKHYPLMTCHPLALWAVGQNVVPGSLDLCRLSIDQSVDFEIDSAIDLQINSQLSRCSSF